MPRTAARFTQADIARAAKGARDAGCVVTGVRIDREGNIEVLCATMADKQAQDNLPRSLAEWRKEPRHGAR